MALAIDSEMPSNVGTDREADADFTWAFNNVAGTLLVVTVVVSDSAGGRTVSGVTYNGVAMTKFNGLTGLGTAKGDHSIWYLVSPATGSNNVVVTLGGTFASNGHTICGAISYTGAAATPLINSTSKTNAGATTDSMDITGTVSGNIPICLISAGSSISTTTQTRSWLDNVNGNTAANNAATQRGSGGGTVNFSVTLSASDSIGFLGAEVAAASGGSTLTPGQGTPTFTGQAPILAKAILMPDEP